MKRIEKNALNLKDQNRQEQRHSLMIAMMNFGIPFKNILFKHSHVNYSTLYIRVVFELTSLQSNTVVYVFKER